MQINPDQKTMSIKTRSLAEDWGSRYRVGLTAISARPNVALTTFASWTDPGHPGLSEKSREREEMEREDIGAIEQLASKKCDVGDNALPAVLQFEAPPMLKQSQ
jgi:hypothetical protein